MKMYAVTQQKDPTNHLALSSRQLVQRQKKHGYQIGCDEQVEQTASGKLRCVMVGIGLDCALFYVLVNTV